MRKKIISLLMIIAVTSLFISCSTQVEIRDEVENSLEFASENGVILERTIESVGSTIPIGFYVGFDKSEGSATVTVTDPNGKEIYSDALKAAYLYPNRPADDLPMPTEQQTMDKIASLTEEQKDSWGFFTFKWLPEIQGEYTLTVTAQNLTASVVYEKLNPTLKNFTGQIEKHEYTVTEPGKKIRFVYQAAEIDPTKGSMFVRVFDPNGEQIRVTTLSVDTKMISYLIPTEIMGTYTAYIDAEDATAIAVKGTVTEQKEIPNLAFLLPALITLLGIAGYLLVNRRNRKLIIWGALFWLGAYFFGLILAQFLNPISGMFWGTYTVLNYWTIISIVSSLTLGIAPLLVGIVADIRNATPKELLGFGAGFVIAPAIFEGLNGISNINTVGKQILPYGSTIIGTYGSVGEAIYKIGVPIIARIGLMAVVFALTMLIIWALRQKTARINKGLIITSSVVGIIFINVLFSYINMIVTQTQAVILFSISYPLGSQILQATIISIIMVIAAVYIYFKRENINTLADEACSVTIHDMKK